MLITRSEFAKKCNVSQAYITQYIKRGNLVVTDNNMIDISSDQNFHFLSKRIESQKSKLQELPDLEIDLFDELQRDFNNTPYNLDSEALAVEIMKKTESAGHAFVLYPKTIAFNIISGTLIEVYEAMLKRQVEIITSHGGDVSKTDAKRMIKEFTGECREKTLSAINDLDRFMAEIMEEFSESPE
jgi:hypothetical protein